MNQVALCSAGYLGNLKGSREGENSGIVGCSESNIESGKNMHLFSVLKGF